MKTKESLTALIFLAILAAVAVSYWTGIYPGADPAAFAGPEASAGELAAPEALAFSARIKEFTQGAEKEVNAVLDRGHFFIQLYGGVQRLAGRRIMKDAEPSYTVIKLSDGTLTFIRDSPEDPALQEESFSRLQDELAQRNTPFLYVQAPNKLAPGDDRLPMGVADYSNSYADGLLTMLSRIGIDTLDLREAFLAADGTWSSRFFSTDHHWTPEGAFLACRTLCDTLRGDYGFVIDAAYTDPDNFFGTVYRDWFLGSQGKRVGSLYGGVDDITAWSPAFPTFFNYEVYSQQINRTGSFDETLMFYEHVKQKDWYNANPYTLYAGGDYPMARITNYLNRGGPRILLVRDSYSCALTPFLALGCSELATFDLRYFGEDDKLLNYVDWLNPDLVILMYCAGPLHLDELLQF